MADAESNGAVFVVQAAAAGVVRRGVVEGVRAFAVGPAAAGYFGGRAGVHFSIRLERRVGRRGVGGSGPDVGGSTMADLRPPLLHRHVPGVLFHRRNVLSAQERQAGPRRLFRRIRGVRRGRGDGEERGRFPAAGRAGNLLAVRRERRPARLSPDRRGARLHRRVGCALACLPIPGASPVVLGRLCAGATARLRHAASGRAFGGGASVVLRQASGGDRSAVDDSGFGRAASDCSAPAASARRTPCCWPRGSRRRRRRCWRFVIATFPTPCR